MTNAADHFPYRALRIPHPLCFLPFFAQDLIHNVSESLTGKQHALCTLSNYGTIVHRYLWYRTLQLSLCRCKLLRIRRHNSINTGAGAPGCMQGSAPINNVYYCLCSTCWPDRPNMPPKRKKQRSSKKQGPYNMQHRAHYHMRGCQHAGQATPPWTVWASCS